MRSAGGTTAVIGGREELSTEWAAIAERVRMPFVNDAKRPGV